MSDLSRTGALSSNYSGDATVFTSNSSVNTSSIASDSSGHRYANSLAIPGGNGGTSGLLEDVFADVFASIASQFHSVESSSVEPAETREITAEAESAEGAETSDREDRDDERTQDSSSIDESLLTQDLTREQAGQVVADEQGGSEKFEGNLQVNAGQQAVDEDESLNSAADQDAESRPTPAESNPVELRVENQSAHDVESLGNASEIVGLEQVDGAPQPIDQTELVQDEALPILLPREKSVEKEAKSRGTDDSSEERIDSAKQESKGTAQEVESSDRVERRRYRNQEQRSQEPGEPAQQTSGTRESVSSVLPEKVNANANSLNTGEANTLASSATTTPISNAIDSVAAAAGAAASQNTPQSKLINSAASSTTSSGTTDAINGVAQTNGLAEKAPANAAAGKKSETRADVVSRVKLVQRVSRAFQHLGPEGGVVRLKLAPAELGSVQVEMRIESKKVNARVVAETEAAAAALREHLPDLRSRLESFGMQVERLEVETESFSGSLSSGFDGSDDRQQPFDAPDYRSSVNGRSVSRPSEESVSATAEAVSRHVAASGVDIRL